LKELAEKAKSFLSIDQVTIIFDRGSNKFGGLEVNSQYTSTYTSFVPQKKGEENAQERSYSIIIYRGFVSGGISGCGYYVW
jgi:hypothetical protein